MATIESLQAEIANLQSDIQTLTVKFATRKDLENLRNTTPSMSQFQKTHMALVGLTGVLGYSIGQGGIIAGGKAVSAATIAALIAKLTAMGVSLAKLKAIFGPLLAMGAKAAAAVLTVVIQLAQAIMLTYGILEVIKRLDVELDIIRQGIDAVYTLANNNLNRHKEKTAAAILILGEADKKIDQKVVKNHTTTTKAVTALQKQDKKIEEKIGIGLTQVRDDFEEADKSIMSNVKTVNAKAIKAQKTADVVTKNHNLLVVSFNGFTKKANQWFEENTKIITTLSELIKKSNAMAESALTSVKEAKAKIGVIEGQIKATIKDIENANTRHDNLVLNFTKLKTLITEWTKETDKALTYISHNIYQIWQQINALKNMKTDLTPVLTRLDTIDNRIVTTGAGLALGLVGVNGSINGGFTNVQQKITAATTAINTNTNKLKDNLKNLASKMDFSWVLQLISAAASLHNAVMLSQDVLQTFFMIFDNLFAIFNVKDADGNALNIGSLVGQGIKDILTSVVGAKTAAEIAVKWNIYNRIYQSATNVYYNIQNLFSTMTNLTTSVLNNTGKIGNALVNYRVIGENAFPTMPENVKPTGRIGKLNSAILNATGSIENIANVANAFSMITSDVLSIKTEIDSTKENIAELNKAIKENSGPIEAISIKDKESSYPSI